MRFQPKGPSRFLLVRVPLSETASPLLYFTRLLTFHSSFRIGSGSLLGSLLPPFPTLTWVRLSSSMSPSHPALPSIATTTTGTGGVCPSVCLSHWAASSVRKGGGHLPSQNLAQSWRYRAGSCNGLTMHVLWFCFSLFSYTCFMT